MISIMQSCKMKVRVSLMHDKDFFKQRFTDASKSNGKEKSSRCSFVLLWTDEAQLFLSLVKVMTVQHKINNVAINSSTLKGVNIMINTRCMKVFGQTTNFSTCFFP